MTGFSHLGRGIKFRAFDKLTGKLLWETALPAAGNATPPINEISGGKYVVIVCGGAARTALPRAVASSLSRYRGIDRARYCL